MTSSTFQHHIFTLNPTKMPAKINGQFSPPNIPHSPFKPSLSSYHLHTDPTQYQPLQPDQSAAITYLRVQSLHQLVFHVVDLAKRVPGFQLMTQHDQLQLIKRQFSTSSSSLLLILIYYYYSRQWWANSNRDWCKIAIWTHFAIRFDVSRFATWFENFAILFEQSLNRGKLFTYLLIQTHHVTVYINAELQ